tara:strand:+ start:216 stop:497 length:282 start_codon:yes stop_codon:yes gene_type:complete
MPLTYETTHEYHLNNASLFYCSEHDTLRVCDNYEDSILLSGVTSKNLNDFIEKYIEYVLKDEDLKDVFKKGVQVKQLNENLENNYNSADSAET